jgi:hypothetical protein
MSIIPAQNIEQALNILKERATDHQLDAERFCGEEASEAWALHHRVNAVVLRCESLLRAGNTKDLHTLLFIEGINVTCIKHKQRSPKS